MNEMQTEKAVALPVLKSSPETPIQKLRYFQGFVLGDGHIYADSERARAYVFDEGLRDIIMEWLPMFESVFDLKTSKWEHLDRRAGVKTYAFDIKGAAALNVHLGLLGELAESILLQAYGMQMGISLSLTLTILLVGLSSITHGITCYTLSEGYCVRNRGSRQTR